MRRIVSAIAAAIILSACSSVPPAQTLQGEIEALQTRHPDVPGFAVTLIDSGGEQNAATGKASPHGTPMTASTPVRIASTTKTFVAASVLRLWEDGRLDLDMPIRKLIKADINALLEGGGYDTGSITVRHLLMHTSGMDEHVGDEYVKQVFANPEKVWTPIEQIKMLVATTDPIGAAGAKFKYSDTGYVILGEIIKDVTQKPLHRAVRDLLQLDILGLSNAYWDELEKPNHQSPRRAHQWIDGTDTYDMHGSMDAHGGGGLVASTQDMAIFYHALFGGKVFLRPETLELMKAAPAHPENSPYRIGLFIEKIGGQDVYFHGGFWGTHAAHMPAKKLTIAGAALDQSGYEALRQFINQTLEAHEAK